MILSIIICLLAFSVLVWLLRRDSQHDSFGLPVAYLYLLLLFHLPGAVAHCFGSVNLTESKYTESGIRITAIAAIFFVVGVWLARCRKRADLAAAPTKMPMWIFCLVGGWAVTYGLAPLAKIPSLGAVVYEAGAIWSLGVLLGLRATMRQGSLGAVFWVGCMLVFPAITLVLSGFLSYGTIAIVICLCPLVISTRNMWRVWTFVLLISFCGIHLFLAYMKNREEIRDAVWGGSALQQRLSSIDHIYRDLQWFDPNDSEQLTFLDARLNQNYFLGAAVERLKSGEVEYKKGTMIWEGFEAMVPRIIWPDKPVVAGSPKIVSEMTGIELSETASFGIGNVMELYINFGISSVVVGFLLLGWAIGALDLMAFRAEASGNTARLLMCFLLAVAIIKPLGSIVEICSGAAASLIAAGCWQWALSLLGPSARDESRAPSVRPAEYRRLRAEAARPRLEDESGRPPNSLPFSEAAPADPPLTFNHVNGFQRQRQAAKWQRRQARRAGKAGDEDRR